MTKKTFRRNLLAACISVSILSPMMVHAIDIDTNNHSAISEDAIQISQETIDTVNALGHRGARHVESFLSTWTLKELASLYKNHLSELNGVSKDALEKVITSKEQQGNVKDSNKIINVSKSEITINPYAQIGLLAGGLGAIALAGGGGGGGGSDETPSVEVPEDNDQPVVPEMPVQPDPEDEPPVTLPDSQSYLGIQGNNRVTVQNLHAEGITGEGVNVAVFDTGVRYTHQEFSGRAHAAYNAYTESEDIESVMDLDGHGTHVLGTIGASMDDKGLTGYAPGANLHVVQLADPERLNQMFFTDVQLRNAYQWAREKDVDFINNSWGPEDTLDDVNPELIQFQLSETIKEFRLGAQSGVVYVWAAGNGGNLKDPSWLAALPNVFEELKNNWVAVTNVDVSTGQLHDSSQKCGVASDYCISAYGTGVLSSYSRDDTDYAMLTGTSMAAPAVTGALALLKSAFPMLTNEQVVQRLFITADKTGVYANSDLYGHGLMNISTAMNPLGQLGFIAPNGEVLLVNTSTFSSGSAMGAENVFAGMNVMVVDEQGAGFYYDMAQSSESHSFRVAVSDTVNRVQRDRPVFVSTSNQDGFMMYRPAVSSGTYDFDADIMIGFSHDMTGTVHAEYAIGRVSNPDLFFSGDSSGEELIQNARISSPFIQSSDSDMVNIASMSLKFDSDTTLSFSSANADDRSTVIMGLSRTFADDSYTLTSELGQTTGQDGILGTRGTGALGISDKTQTLFMGLRGKGSVGDHAGFTHSAYLGKTSANGSGIVSQVDDILTSSWSASFYSALPNHKDITAGFAVSQPLRVESGGMNVDVVTGYKGGAYVTETHQINFAPSGRQINSEMFIEKSSRNGSIRASLMHVNDPGHNSSRQSDHAGMLSYKLKF